MQFDDSCYVDAKQYHLASFSTRNSTLNTSLRKPIRMQDVIQLCDSIVYLIHCNKDKYTMLYVLNTLCTPSTYLPKKGRYGKGNWTGGRIVQSLQIIGCGMGRTWLLEVGSYRNFGVIRCTPLQLREMAFTAHTGCPHQGFCYSAPRLVM